MTRATRLLDRLAVLLVGLALLTGGLLAVDWHLDLTGLTRDDPIATGSVVDVLERGWVTWVAGVAGVVVALLGLRWLLSHVGRGGPSTHRLSGSAPTGRLEVDLGALADVVAERLVEHAPVEHARSRTRRLRGTHVLEVRARLAPGADPDQLVSATRQAAAETAAALPGEAVTCRVLVDAPGRPRTGRRTTARVR